MKKLTSIMMAVVIILTTVLSVPGLKANASSTTVFYPVTGGNLTFDTSTGAITGCGESVTEAMIPSEIEGVSVTSIRDHAFMERSNLTSIELPTSLTSIGDYAFEYCSSLTSIELPASLTSIGDYAFEYCSSLTNIELPASLTSIGDYVFYSCSNLTSIDLPASLTSIGNSAFYNCSSLTSIELPASLTSIGNSAFCDCSSLTSINLPASLTYLGFAAFTRCESLTSIDLPASLTSIGDSTFQSCSKLTSINLPASLTSIGNFAFFSCESLTSINVDTNNTKYSSVDGVLFNKDQTVLICYPGGKKETTYIIPTDVTSIGYSAFGFCSSLTSIDLPASLTSIGDYVFYSCSNLTSIDLPASLTSIGDFAFHSCSNLTSINLPANLTFIGDSVFNSCESLTSIEIPASLTSIYSATFSGCSNLASIDLPASLTFIGVNAFYNCNDLTDVYYSGNEKDWNTIRIRSGNEDLLNATIHYNSSLSSETEHVTSANNVTEDMLFSTEYCTHLNNVTYRNMIDTLENDMAFIGSDDQWGDFNIALKTCFSSGVIGQLKLIGSNLWEEISGKNLTEEKIQEELTLAYVNNIDSHSEYIKDLFDSLNSSLSSSNEIIGILKEGASTGSDILEYTANDEQIKKLADKLADALDYDDKEKVNNDLKKLLKSSETMKKASNVLKYSGEVISAYQIAVSIETLKLTSETALKRYMSLVDKDKYGGIYTGLKINYDNLKKKDIILFAQKVLEEKGADEVLGLITEFITGKVFDVAGAVAVVEFAYTITDLMMSHVGVIDLEDWLKVRLSLDNQMELYGAWSTHYLNILNNYLGKETHDIKDLKKDYQDIWELYTSCILTSPDYLEDYSGNSVIYSNLENDLKKYKSLLTYENYIKSCLKNANAVYTYTVNDGMATITDVDLNPGSSEISTHSLMKAAKLSTKSVENTSEFYLDIPSEVDGYPVVAIGEGVFQDNQGIAAVSIPNTITNIKSNAFNGCENMKQVFLEPGLNLIGENAFSGCTQLTSINIPDTVTSISNNAFDQSITIKSCTDSVASEYATLNRNNIEIRDKEIKELTIHQMPDKTSYAATEELDLSGLSLNVTYVDGSTEVIDSGYSGYIFDRQKGTNKAVIYYNGAVTTFDVEITSGECEYIVQYIDESGETIHESFKGSAEIGTEVSLEIPKIEGYTSNETERKETIKGNNVFTISYATKEKKNIEEASVVYNNSYMVTGSNIEPDVQVSLNNELLQKDTDYTVEYSNNLKAGTGNIWITGIGDYEGILIYNFSIIDEKQNNNPNTGNKNPSMISSEKIGHISLTALSNKVAAGKRMRLTADILPANAVDQRLVWSSSNPKVATVDQNGVVSVRKKTGGKSVTITATAADGSGTKAVFRIKSMKGVVKKVTIAGAKKRTLKAGKKLKLKAKVTATKGANKKLVWTSSNTKYATVTASGKVKTMKAGKGKKVKITAMATDGSNKKMTVTIKLK